jgi:hypothetical protein
MVTVDKNGVDTAVLEALKEEVGRDCSRKAR